MITSRTKTNRMGCRQVWQIRECQPITPGGKGNEGQHIIPGGKAKDF